jgi:3-methyladenine DNA glycosylase AlkD
MTSKKTVLRKLKLLGNAKDRAGMARFGIETKNAYGISVYVLRALAKEIGIDHALALQLWKSGIHEARLLASFIDDPVKVTESQMERWVNDFDSWDVCDQCCGFLFDKTKFAEAKAVEWSKREREFVKRAGFVLMAALSVHDKKATDAMFVKFFPIIQRESRDARNFVKKAVNWALRQIGKRNRILNKKAIEIGQKIGQLDSKSAKWIASDALRELTSKKVQQRLKK